MNKQMKTLDGVYFNDVTARQQIAGKADRVHTHSFNQLTNKPQIPEQYDDTQIRQQIAGKANAVHTHSYNDLTDKPTIPEGYDDALVKSDIVSLNEALVTLPKDVQVSGTSIVGDDGKANFNVSNGSYGILYHSTQGLRINQASITNIDRRDSNVHPITPYRINYAVKAALTDSNRIGTDNDGLTSSEKDTACAVVGAERAKGDWVLKGTIGGTADDRGNMDDGVTVDLVGCTEVSIIGTSTGTGNTFIRSFVRYADTYFFGYVSRNGSMSFCVIAEDSQIPDGFYFPFARYNNDLSGTSYSMAMNYCYSDNKGKKLSSITKFGFVNASMVTSCDIKIYAR